MYLVKAVVILLFAACITQTLGLNALNNYGNSGEYWNFRYM